MTGHRLCFASVRGKGKSWQTGLHVLRRFDDGGGGGGGPHILNGGVDGGSAR